MPGITRLIRSLVLKTVRPPNPIRRQRRAHRPGLAEVGGFVLCFSVLGACNNLTGGDATHKINGGVHVIAGTPPATAATVNGGIDVDENAAVTSAATVNGGVHMGANATADSLHVVNGGVVLEKHVRVSGSVKSVNGGITLRDESEVMGPLENVNGDINLQSAHVGGGIRTVNANINVLGSSRVEGGIQVKHNSGDSVAGAMHVPRIVVGPGATVSGEMLFERPVKLFVSERATIGAVTGATVERYAGDEPPVQAN